MIDRFGRADQVLFLKSFSVSALVGLSYIIILELAQMILGYKTGFAHASIAFVFYVLGIFVNYLLQKKVVFRSDRSPLLGFFVYNLINALLVSSMSGLFFENGKMNAIFGQFIEGASIALALLIISPVTFFIFKKLFKKPNV